MFATRKPILAALFTCLVALTLAASPVRATNQGSEEFILMLSEQALDLLKKDTMSQDERESGFRELFATGFDIDRISRFALGRYWRAATPAERDEYRVLFEDFIVKAYSARLGTYEGESFTITDTLARSETDSLVRTVIESPNGSSIRVDWRVRLNDGEYKIVDVVIEGVSMVITHRSEFASVIQHGGGRVQALIDALRAQAVRLD